ncbi:MAG: hypothetical protein LAP13_05580 [Acidobacteriia bacterium]|nr:hypothetical protein [Terriglobia bacterium]
MLEQKLIADRFLNLPQAMLTRPGLVPPHRPGDFVLYPPQLYHIQDSTGVFTKTSAVVPGAGAPHRTFNWLVYTAGLITQVAMLGTDVLTGPMSGCFLIVFRKANGVPHVAHVGTHDTDAVQTAAVQQAWNAFAQGHLGDIVGGFNPLRAWNGPLPARKAGDGAPYMFGLCTSNNQFYAVFTFQQANPATSVRIAGLQHIASATPQRLQHIDRPGP